MRDGTTRKIQSLGSASFERFHEERRAKLVVVDGAQLGMEYLIDAPRKTIGRGPGVDWVCRNGAMSRQHAAILYVDGAFRIEDLGSTNGIERDGERHPALKLEVGDRFRLGDQEFQLVVEARDARPEVYEITVDA